MPTWCRCAPPILFWPLPPFNLFPRSCLTWSFYLSLPRGTALCAAPSKSYDFPTNYACIAMPTWCRCAPPILYYSLCSSPTIKVFSPVQPGPEFAGSSRYCPRFTKIYLQSPSSRFITVCPGRHTSTPGLINQDHPGGHPFHPGGHPVQPGQHTVHYSSLRSTHSWLQFLTVHSGQHTVHYGNSDHPGQHQVHYGSSRSTPGLNFLSGLMPVRPNYQTCLIF